MGCVNSLILLASFVGSFMLSNQMRGRAIRIWPENLDKVKVAFGSPLIWRRKLFKKKEDEEVAVGTDSPDMELQRRTAKVL